MYVCLCKGITDKDVQKACRRNDRGQDVCKRLGVGAECGLCIESALKIIQEMEVAQGPNINSSQTESK